MIGVTCLNLNAYETVEGGIMDDLIRKLEKYYNERSVIYSPYWRTYELVLSFNYNPSLLHYSDWSVTVIDCNKDGIPLTGASPRTHCTKPLDL